MGESNELPLTELMGKDVLGRTRQFVARKAGGSDALTKRPHTTNPGMKRSGDSHDKSYHQVTWARARDRRKWEKPQLEEDINRGLGDYYDEEGENVGEAQLDELSFPEMQEDERWQNGLQVVEVGPCRLSGDEFSSSDFFVDHFVNYWLTLDEQTTLRSLQIAGIESLLERKLGTEVSFDEVRRLEVDPSEGVMLVREGSRDEVNVEVFPWTRREAQRDFHEWIDAIWPDEFKLKYWEYLQFWRYQDDVEQGIQVDTEQGFQNDDEADTDAWNGTQSADEWIRQLRENEAAHKRDERQNLEDRNWGEAGYEGEDDDGLTDEDRRDWEMLQRLFDSDDEHLRQQHGSQINGEKNPDQRRALQQWVAKQGKPEEKVNRGTEIRSRGRDETSVDSRSWTRRRHATNLGRSKAPDTNFSDPTYGDAQRDAGERRAKEKLEWQRDVEQGVEDINSPDRFWDEYEEYLDTLPEESREWSYADVEDVNEGLTDHMPTREDILKKLKNSSSNKWSRMAWRGDMRMQGKSPQKEKPPYYTDEQWEEVKRIGELKGLVAEIKLKRRIDEHRRKLQGQVTQQRQEQKHRSSERVDWYKKMMRDRNAKSRETRERGGGARHPGLAVGIPQVKGK